MKICAVVAEYNPLHLGHIKHIDYIKRSLGAENLIVIMSGNFTQRGEPAILNKFKRAKAAVMAGADVVIELPSVFATAGAEVFAKGAIKILDGLNIIDGLCFGAESGEKEDFISLAAALSDESKEFKKVLKDYLEQGYSLAKSRFLAVKDVKREDFDEDLILKPNNILGIEYTKALINLNSGIGIYPMKREEGHGDVTLKKGVTSALSIRQAIKSGNLKKTKKSLPKYSYADLKSFPHDFDKMILSALYRADEEYLAALPDCTEGLEHRIKALLKDNYTVESLVKKVSTKRYTESRIRRIFVANLLGITKNFQDECLKEPLYAKVLAVNSSKKDLISLMDEKSSIPVVTRKSQAAELKKTAEKCYAIDSLACDIYDLATGESENHNRMLVL